MSEWTAPADLKAQVLRLWDRDELLLATFPLRLTLRVPSSKALSARFDEARAWVAELQQAALQQGELQPKTGQGYRLVMREVRHSILGTNSLPGEAWVDTPDDALRLIGKLREGKVFRGLLAATQQQPALLPWLQIGRAHV